MSLRIVPIELADANAFVGEHHRHHKPVVGHRFSIGAADGPRLCGVCIVGRPVARMVDFHRTAEVTRVATDGTANACSLLYGAAARTARAMGYEKIQTYLLSSESGVSLKASGWNNEGEAGGGQWKHTDGKPRRTDQPTGLKTRWSRCLNAWQDFDRPPCVVVDETLFDAKRKSR